MASCGGSVSIRKITENKRDFMPLLLLGDENESYINAYLNRGDLFALYDGDLKSVCVVTDEGGGVFEIQNIATDKRLMLGRPCGIMAIAKALLTSIWMATSQ